MNKYKYDWSNITIDQYYNILDVLNSDSDDLDKNVELLSIVSGMSIDEILGMSMQKVAEELLQLRFLNTFTLIPNYHPNRIKLGDEMLIVQDTNKMCYGQFIDYQAYVKKPLRNSIHLILSVFLIPEGKNYNSGYDILEVQKLIRDKMSFREAQSLLNFMLTKYIQSYKDSLKYLVKQMNKIRDPEKKETMMLKIQEMNKQMKNLASTIGYAYLKG